MSDTGQRGDRRRRQSGDQNGEQPASPPRRDFVVTAAFALAGAGLVTAVWPFVSALGPGRGREEADMTTVDLNAIPAGTAHMVAWLGRPYLIRHRTSEEVRQAKRQVPTVDLFARNENLDRLTGAGDENRTLPGRPTFLVISAQCSNGDCIVRDGERVTLDDGLGWMCPCCASRFDFSGRVVSGPARQNLPVPRYKMRDGRLLIGAR